MIRLKSSALTGGAGNPVVATAEAGSSITLSILAIFIPAIAVIIVGAMVVYFSFMIKKKFFSPPQDSYSYKILYFPWFKIFNIPFTN